MDVVDVLGLPVCVTSKADAADMIIERALAGQAGYYCFVNTHMCVEANANREFMSLLRRATGLFADSRPVYWYQLWRKQPSAAVAEQVRGVDLMRRLCAKAAADGVPIGLWGGNDDDVLSKLKQQLTLEYPGLNVVFAVAPPFVPLTDSERSDVATTICSSGAKLLFVGLGCPKQERWMAQFAQLPLQMLGVGAAFDFLALRRREAPVLLQRVGFEWLFRLSQEPSRLLWRYLKNNTQFVLLIIKYCFKR